MAGRSYYRNGRWYSEEEMDDIKVAYFKRPAGPMIITDSLGGGIMNHADGNYYDSKAAFKKATAAAGCIEVGNESVSNYFASVQADKEAKEMALLDSTISSTMNAMGVSGD